MCDVSPFINSYLIYLCVLVCLVDSSKFCVLFWQKYKSFLMYTFFDCCIFGFIDLIAVWIQIVDTKYTVCCGMHIYLVGFVICHVIQFN